LFHKAGNQVVQGKLKVVNLPVSALDIKAQTRDTSSRWQIARGHEFVYQQVKTWTMRFVVVLSLRFVVRRCSVVRHQFMI
jgi:hypothetical protein